MSRIDEIPTNSNLENLVEAAEAVPEGIQDYFTDTLPIARNAGFSLSHKHPELQELLNQTEIQTARLVEQNEKGPEQSISAVHDTFINYFVNKYGNVPLDTLLSALETPAGKDSHFMLEGKLRSAFV